MPLQKLSNVSGNRSLTVAARIAVAALIGAATVRERMSASDRVSLTMENGDI
jgi:hypothetical protein